MAANVISLVGVKHGHTFFAPKTIFAAEFWIYTKTVMSLVCMPKDCDTLICSLWKEGEKGEI